MAKKRNVAAIYWFLLCPFTAFCIHPPQQLVTAAGNLHKTSDVQISWSLGEVQTEIYANKSYTLYQGFQQGRIKITIIDQIQSLGYSISAYPNPASDFITIHAEDNAPVQLLCIITDINGKLLLKKNIESGMVEIDCSHFQIGTYLLKIIAGTNTVKTFKILKKQ